MAYRIVLECPGAPTREVLETALEAMVKANAEWFRVEWAAGREPPCCLGCAGVKYRPDRPGTTSATKGADAVLREGFASCQSAAVYYAGRERALALEAGEANAALDHRAVLDERAHGDAPDGYWHALVVQGAELKDVTEEMDR